MSRRIGLVAIIAVLVFSMVLSLDGADRTSAQSWAYFSSATSDCWVARFTVEVLAANANTLQLVDRQRQPDEYATLYVTAVDAKGNFLGDYNFYSYLSASGHIWYENAPIDSVTLTLYEVLGGYDLTSSSDEDTPRGGRMARPATQTLGAVLDTRVIPVDCYEAVPGCDITIEIPEGSVVGQFIGDAATHWEPGKQTQPVITIPAGKTAWVIGVDLTRQYYKIVWVCNYLWVDVNTMGPNPDGLWKSAPLPQRTVK